MYRRDRYIQIGFVLILMEQSSTKFWNHSIREPVLIEKNQEQWEKLGAIDPYWAVLSDRSKIGGRWDKLDFFATGSKEIRAAIKRIDELGISLNYTTSLDFGCGVGRLSRALSEIFTTVLAIDISQSMLEEAEKANQGIQHIKYIHNTKTNFSMIPDNHVDFVYSNLVLQHIPSEAQKLYIQEFCRVLSPRGVMIIQTPSHVNYGAWQGWAFKFLGNNILNQIRRVKIGGASGIMEIHLLPKSDVIPLIQQGSVDIVEIEHNFSTGIALESFTYIGQKREY